MSTKWVPRGPSCVTHAQLSWSTQKMGGLGHGVVSGRISAIALSPDGKTIYAGAASGGVWRSRDDGANWTPLLDDQPSLSVGALAVASDDTVYVGTGEFNSFASFAGIMTGVGILRSTNHGQTWTLIPPQQAGNDLVRARIARIVVHPTRTDEIYAATSRGLFVATSTDRAGPSGATFGFVTPAGVAIKHCTDVAVDFTDPDAPIVYAGFTSSGIHKIVGQPLDTSLEVADRFPAGAPLPLASFPGAPGLASVNKIGLAMAQVRPEVLYAVFATGDEVFLYRNDHAGAGPWADFNTAAFGEQSSPDFKSLLAVDPRDPETVFFGDERLWRRRPGRDWVIETARRDDYAGVHDDQHALAFDPTDPAVVWLGNDGGVWKSIDGGEHFYARNRGLATAQLYAMAQFTGEPAVLFAGTQDLGSISTRGHAAWRQFVGGDAYFTAIDPTRPRLWYFGLDPADDMVVRFSAADADMRAWKSLSGTGPAVPPDAPAFVFITDPNVAGRLFLGGTDTLYWWRDASASRWEDIPETELLDVGEIWAIAVAPSDSNVVYYARTTGEVHRIQRVGDAWQAPITSNAIVIGAVSDERVHTITVDPADPDHFFVGIGNGQGPDSDDPKISPRIYEGRHTGAALNLSPFTELPDVVIGDITVEAALNHVNALVLDPAAPGVIYAGTDYGVYRWTGVWARFSDALPAALVVTQMYLHAESRRLRVSSLGRGVWECLLDGPEVAVDLYVRDHVLDDGSRASLPARQNPVTLAVLHWTDGPDIKLDTERMLLGGFESLSTVGYDGSGGVDYLGFEALDSDNPRGGAESRVYVQVHNRGPAPAHEVNVRLFWAKKAGDAFPDLPADFWARHLADTFDTTHWKPLGGAQKIIELVPGTPRVARFDWTASGSNDTIGILAVVSSPQDPLPALPLVVETAVRTAKHVALRECNVNPATYKIVLEVLAVVGLVGLAAVEAPKLL